MPTDAARPHRTLQSALAEGRFALTVEVVPPLSGEPGLLLDRALPFHGLADAINLTDSASARPHMCALASGAILVANGIDPIVQFTCRDRNRIAIQSDILGAAALGIRNFLFMHGDQPSAGDQPDAKPVFDMPSIDVMRMVRAMRDEQILPGSRKIAGGLDGIAIGCADMPVDPQPGWEPKGLAQKLAAGASFAQTQFCMDAGIARRYAARLAEHGLADKVKLIVGVVPLRSAKSAAWIRQNLYGSIIPDAHLARMEQASDQQAEGVRICAEVIAELRTIPGIAGAHIMAPNNDAGAIAVLKAIRG